MADIENNSTQTPLPAFGIYTGKSNQPSVDYITIAVSFTIDVPGTLTILHSVDDINYHSFGDELSFTAGSHSFQVSRKLAYFKVHYLNGVEPQGVFELYTRILKNLNQDLSVSTNKDFDTITVFAPQTGFLNSIKDSVTITGLVSTNLDKCITGNSIQVEIMNQSGLNNVNIFDSFGNSISSTEGKLDVNATVNVPHLNYTTDSVSIGGTLPALTYARDAVNVSGSSVSISSGSVSVSNMISGFATATNQTLTNTKLDTINTTITNKTSNGLNDSIQIYGSNGITNKPFLQDNYQTLYTNSVDNSINDAPFDLLINGSTLWSDSSPAGNPFFADLNGRQGWYYDNFNNAGNISNIYWYANPVSGSLKENNMAFSSLGSMYAIITCDYVENGELTIPFMGVYSQPTGSGDFIPGFAHSRWVYQLNADNRAKLRKGETILIYTGSTRPNYHVNLPAYPLSLASQNGDCSPLEIIAYMTVNTQGTTSKIGYLLQYCGYMNSLIGFNREYEFRNSKERLIESNLSASKILVDTGLTFLNVDVGITNIAINNFSELNGLTVDTGLTSIFINNSSLNVDTGLTSIFVNNFSELNGLTVDTGLTSIFINNTSINVDTGLTSIFVNNFSELNGLNVDTGLTSIFINNSSLNVDTGLTNLAINNFSELNGLTVDTGLTSIFINNSSLNVNTGLTGFALESTLQSIKAKTDLLSAGVTAFGPNIAVSVVNGVLVRSETYSGDGDSISATYNPALNKIGLDTTIVNANPIAVTCSNFPTGFKVLDDSGNGLGYGTNPLIIDGSVSITNDTIGISGLVNVSGNVGITGGVHCQGYDFDTGTYNDMYVDVDGVQRTEIVQPHIISARYNIETDASVIAVTSTSNPSGNYTVDTRGRTGWLYQNSLVDNDLNWYKNTISSPPSLTYQKLQGLYSVVCFDKLPTNAFHSYFVITTTASIWIWYNPLTQIPSIYPGETYLLYGGTGQKTYQKFPEIQNSCKLEMLKSLNSGPGNNNEVITKIEFHNTAESSLGVYQYLISECGLYDGDRQNWFQVYFRNTIDFRAETNLSNLQLDGSNNLKTASRTQDGSGNNITSTLNGGTKQSLDVNVSNTVPVSGTFWQATQPVSGTVAVSNSFTLDTTTQTTNTTLTSTNTKLDTGNGYLNTINQGIGFSYLTATALNNIATIAGSTTYSTFYTWTRGQYGRNSVLVYSDGSTSNLDSISIYSKDGSGNDFMIGVFYPIVVAGARRWTLTMNLAPFNQISVRNNSSSSIVNVSLTLYTA